MYELLMMPSIFLGLTMKCMMVAGFNFKKETSLIHSHFKYSKTEDHIFRKCVNDANCNKSIVRYFACCVPSFA